MHPPPTKLAFSPHDGPNGVDGSSFFARSAPSGRWIACPHSWLTRGLMGIGVLLVSCCFVAAQGSQVELGEEIEVSVARASIERALNRECFLRFEETELIEVARQISESIDAPVVLDIVPLENIGLSGDVPVTIHLRGVSLRSGLNLMLRELDMTYSIRDEVLLLTTAEASEMHLEMRLYDVTDLVEAAAGNDYYTRQSTANVDRLAEVIMSNVAIESWAQVGGPASVEPLNVGDAKVLVVQHIDSHHAEIEAFLSSLRELVAERAAEANASRPNGEGGADGLSMRIYPIQLPEGVSVDEYVELIQTVIDPGNWEQDESVMLAGVASTIVVRHKPPVHVAVSHLLQDAGVLVDVDATDRNGRPSSSQPVPNGTGGGLFSVEDDPHHK